MKIMMLAFYVRSVETNRFYFLGSINEKWDFPRQWKGGATDN